MATLTRGEKDVLQRLAAGKFHNGTSATLARLASNGLLTLDPPCLTPEGKKRVERLMKASGRMHNRTWFTGHEAIMGHFAPKRGDR